MLKMYVAVAAATWALLATPVWPAMAQEPPSVVITTPIQFADGTVSGPLLPRDIDDLLSRKVTGKGIWMNRRADSMHVSSCRQYIYLSRHAWEVQFSMAELENSQTYEWVCAALELMRTARPYRHSRIEGVRIGTNGLAHFPASMLPAWSPTDIDDERQESPGLEVSGRTLVALRDEGGISMTAGNADRISIRYAGSQREISEIARADFDGDGENDVLALVSDTKMTARGSSTYLRTLDLRSDSGLFEMRDPWHPSLDPNHDRRHPPL